MAITVDEVYSQALTLTDDSKESLAERLVAYIETHVAPDIERAHLDEARRRRDEIRTGLVMPVDGESVMTKARELVGK
jgi:Putative addiction module component